VIVIGAVCALLGDALTFAATRFGGPRMVELIGRRVDTAAVDRVTAKLNARGGRFLVVSRLIPAGRIPCLLAAGIADFPWRSFLPYQTLGAVLWALAYGLLGLVGGGLFRNPYTATGIALGLVLLVQAVQYLVTRRRKARVAAPR
jgi:membrane protein DedA with SNARE-associated domain